MIARWWPPIGVAAMVLLGWAVRRGPVPVDIWFQRLGSEMGAYGDAFLLFTTPLLMTAALIIGIVVAVRQHRTGLALAMAVSPPVAIGIVRISKPLFGREKGGALAYPSGHTTFLVVVVGLLVVVAGVTFWAVLIGLCVSLLGTFGQAVTYHYFTDALGAALLGTSVVCVAAMFDRFGRADRDVGMSPELR
ncbi:PA-phosphatase [Mycobacterium sp. E802]|uniref:PA-phosphatase n=1 Tax=Mycobacterium sp. E802 TaxID=1834152 RepID=UPI0007FE834E|nr:PA-phosphatase [Mycobacterium sp. E802]OBG80553.1 PA-phosphatase [Mycobacterium sp. E802]